MNKKIVYIGLERCDFIYQLAKIASLKGTVLLIDNSRTGDLFSIIGQESTDNIVERRNLHITQNIDVEKSDTSSYDFVLIYAGMDVDKEYYTDNPLVLVMPDFTELCLNAIEDNLPPENANAIYILRDYCTKKITDKGIAQRFNINKSKIVGKIPLSLADIAAYTAFTHNRTQSLAALSDMMRTALIFVTAKLFDMDMKNAGKLVDKAKKL